MKKKVFITGASGYLGGIVSRELHQNGYHCVLGSRHPEIFSHIEDLKNLETREFDMAKPESFSQCLKGIDAVVHLVSLSSQECEQNSAYAHKINTELAGTFLETAIEAHVKQFIYLSTFHVYGPKVEGIITENTRPDPVSVYAKTHLETEKFLLQKIGENKIDGAIIRLSNAMGYPVTNSKEAWTLVANDLCSQAVKNKSLTLNSSGCQKRDFIAVTCVGQAVDFLLNKAQVNYDLNPVFNLGSEQTISILELAEKIQHICHKKFGYTPELTTKKETAVSMPASFTYSTGKLRSLGFFPKITVDEEIEKTLTSLAG